MTAPNNAENLALLWSINFLAAAVQRAFDRRALTLGYTETQWRVLLSISKFEGIGQSDLARSLAMQSTVLSRTLDRLEIQGLVKRLHPNDNRVVNLFTSEQAKPVLLALHDIGREVQTRAADGIPSETLTQLGVLLRQMTFNIDRSEIRSVGAEEKSKGAAPKSSP